MAIDRLSRADLPRLYRVASTTSRDGRRTHVVLTAVVLLAGIASALLALAGGSTGPSWHAKADVGAALLFVVTTVGAAWLGGGEAQRRWYDGRAAAESIKTLSWKYMMRAAPFDGDDTADQRFLERMRDVLGALRHLRLADVPGFEGMISPAMRELRAAPVETKRAVYRRDRIADQSRWYGTEAAWAQRRAQRWRIATVVLGTAGVAGSLVRATGAFNVDALGCASALLASIAAWTQLRQYWPNAAAYRLALNELNIIADEAEQVTDDIAWAAFCERAETAISREHTMWRARAR
jgi:hypothetical protein